MESIYWGIVYFAKENITLFIAIIALLVSARGLKQKEKHDKLSVRPEIGGITNIFENEMKVYQKNIGLGPAKITDFKLFVTGKEIQSDNLTDFWIKYFKELKIPYTNIHHHQISPPFVMQVNEELVIIEVNASPPHKYSPVDQEKFKNAIKTFELKITFESMYKEKFKYEISFLK